MWGKLCRKVDDIRYTLEACIFGHTEISQDQIMSPLEIKGEGGRLSFFYATGLSNVGGCPDQCQSQMTCGLAS